MRSAALPVHEGDPDFDTRLLPRLRALPFFRLATDDELDASYRTYLSGDFPALCDTWCRVAQPTRCTVPGTTGRAYAKAGLAPRMASAHAFLASLRAVLEAGKRFRGRLRPELTRVLGSEFPWLEHRHEHIPPGWTPPFEFPNEFNEFIDVATDEARARWQLVAALNEVQQAHYSAYAAGLFRLPELRAHAARERALACNYFDHWAPPASPSLWRQCVLILDGLNAAVMHMVTTAQRGPMIRNALVGMVARRKEWRIFVEGLQRPQRLLGVPHPT
jgi:hypothetical protein